jgi:hypothetical protein
MTTMVLSKEDATKVVRVFDLGLIYDFAVKNNIKVTSLRIPGAAELNHGTLARKILRRYVADTFPACDVKLLSRGVRVEMTGVMKKCIRFIYNRSIYGDDIELRRELVSIPEVSASINAIASITMRGPSAVEVCHTGSFIVFRMYENDFNGWGARGYGSNVEFSRTPFNMFLSSCERVKAIRAGMEEMNVFLSTADSRIAAQRIEEERRVAMEAEESREIVRMYFNDFLASITTVPGVLQHED